MENNKLKKVEFYVRETGGIVMVVNDLLVYSLDEEGNWVPNQHIYSMFVDDIISFKKISNEEVNVIIQERKNKGGMKK